MKREIIRIVKVARSALLFVPFALSACATVIPENQRAYAIQRYGPECGVNDEILRAPASDPKAQAAARCIHARWQADNAPLNEFLRGFAQGAGGTLSPDVYNAQHGLPPSAAPTRTDFKCMSDCENRGYAYQLCQARCSY